MNPQRLEAYIRELTDLYNQSNQRPYIIGDQWINRMGLAELVKLYDTGMDLQCPGIRSYVRGDVRYLHGRTDNYNDLILTMCRMLPLDDLTIQVPLDINPDAVELLVSRGFQITFDCSIINTQSLQSCFNVLHNIRSMEEPPTIRNNCVLLILILDFLEKEFTLVRMNTDKVYGYIRIRDHLIWIKLPDYHRDYEVRFDGPTINYPRLMNSLKNLGNRIVRVNNIDTRLTYCAYHAGKGREIPPGPVELDQLVYDNCPDMTIQLLLLLHHRGAIDIADYADRSPYIQLLLRAKNPFGPKSARKMATN